MSSVLHARRLTLAALLLVFVAFVLTSCGTTAPPRGWAAPTLDGSTVYYFPKKDRLTAAEITADGSLRPLWQFPDKARPNEKKVDFDAVYSAPIRQGDRLFFASYDGQLFALNAADGHLLWQREDIRGSIVGGPTDAGDFLAFGTTDGNLYLVTKADGQAAPGWAKHGVDLGQPIWAAPVRAGDSLYAATIRGKLHAFAIAGAVPRWSGPIDVDGAVADLALLTERLLFVPTLKKHVAVVDLAQVPPAITRFDTSDWVWTRPAFKDNVAYFGDFGGTIYALDITIMQTKWTAPADDLVKAAPAILGDLLVIADKKPTVQFLELGTGALRGNRIPVESAGRARGDFSSAGPYAYMVTTKGRLYRADPTGAAPAVTEIVLRQAGR